jgi:aerobic C4-dicarboxylate transport protein
MITDSADDVSQKRGRPLYKDLSVQILVAMLLGVLAGYLWPESADAMKPLGDLFIKLVRMLVAPIIFCTVVHGIASVSDVRRVGRVAIKALIYFESVTTIALVVGLVLVNTWAPGIGMNVDRATLAASNVPNADEMARAVGFGEFLLNLVPASAVGAFADGDVIPVLFFSLLFAFALLAMGPKGRPAVDAIHFVSQVLFKMMGLVMYVAPIGAFGAIAFTVRAVIAAGARQARCRILRVLRAVRGPRAVANRVGVWHQHPPVDPLYLGGTDDCGGNQLRRIGVPARARQTASTRCRRAGCRARVAGWLRVQP